MTDQQLVCDGLKSTLLVIDIQQRLVDAMSDKIVAATIQNTSRLVQAANILSIPVINTEQYPQGLGATVAPLAEHIRSTALSKTCFSCCGAENFNAALNYDRPQVIITGMESHVCVLQTALQLVNTHQVFVVNDAVCARNKHHHHNAMTRLQQAGVIVTNHESVLFEWMRDASHPHFKAISALIK